MGVKTKEVSTENATDNVVAFPETEGWFNIDVVDDNGKSVRVGGIPLAYKDAKGNENADITNLINALRANPAIALRLKFSFNDNKAPKQAASFS